jgi:hypothetical protein
LKITLSEYLRTLKLNLMKNNILILAALLLLASCSQKQFSFRKTIKVNSNKQQELVLEETKEEESSTLAESENNPAQEFVSTEATPIPSGHDMMVETNQEVEQPVLTAPKTYTPPVEVKEKKSIEKLLPSKIEQKLNKKSGGDGSTAAILGFVFGVLAIAFMFSSSAALALLSLLLLIAGMVLSIVGLNSDNRTFALIGLILNILGLVLWLLVIIIVAAALSGGAV